MTKRWIAWTAAVALMIVVVVSGGATAIAADAPASVRIRIYDYASIEPERLAQAQAFVTRAYDAIGVGVRWAGTIGGADVDGSAHDADVDPRDLMVIILNASMTERVPMPKDALGMAATTPNEGGRIAYVAFDRVGLAAGASNQDAMEVMGLVIAHELGHLLLPHGSHSGSGLMRGRWDVGDLRPNRGRIEFTRTQAAVILQALQH